MKTIKLVLTILSMMATISTMGQEYCMIMPNTTMIKYYYNSDYSCFIYEDSLVCSDFFDNENYLLIKKRTDRKTVSMYKKSEFKELIKNLSHISFTVKNTPAPDGWEICFLNKNGLYLDINQAYILSGAYREALDLIEDFLRKHKPEGVKFLDTDIKYTKYESNGNNKLQKSNKIIINSQRRRGNIQRQIAKIRNTIIDTTEMKAPMHLILPNTTKISYDADSNSAEMIYNTYTIFEDSLVWNYSEERKNIALRDVYRYDKKEYKAFLRALCSFSIAEKARPGNSGYGGDSGWYYSFYNNERFYFSYGQYSYLAGEHREITKLINDFIVDHTTEGEKQFNKYRMATHERGEFGTFKEIPEELRKYSYH